MEQCWNNSLRNDDSVILGRNEFSQLDWRFCGVSAPEPIEIIFILCALWDNIPNVDDSFNASRRYFGGIFDSAFDTDISMDSLAMELFSIQGITAAIAMFGMTGMFTIESTGVEVLAVIVGGISVVALFAVKSMLKGKNLQADGTMKHTDAIGQTGQVYSRIRENGTGEIQVSVDGTLRTLEARAIDKNLHIKSGELIKVFDVIGATMIVELLNIDNKSIDEEE